MSDVVGLYRRFGVKLKPLGDGWVTCRCFTGTHQDRHPSARVHLRSGGFRCFTCGARGGCLDALEILGADRDEARRLAVDYGILDPPRSRPRPPPQPIPPPSPPPPPPPAQNKPAFSATDSQTKSVADNVNKTVETLTELGGQVDWDQLTTAQVIHDRTWVYTNRDNEPVGRVRRLDLTDGRKRIWQERPDGDGGWVGGLEGAHLPLYQLPAVLEHAAAGRRILIVEGEKAVDALHRLGHFATTNPGGAGKWRPQHTRALHGATAQAICDSDAPGRQHAWQISAELIENGVTTRMPLDLAPLANDGRDIVDHLAAVAETTRQVAPNVTPDTLRNTLERHLAKLLAQQLPADSRNLQLWHEHAQYLTNPDGRTYLECPRCHDRRVHRTSHGIAFCPCGHHQHTPAKTAAV